MIWRRKQQPVRTPTPPPVPIRDTGWTDVLYSRFLAGRSWVDAVLTDITIYVAATTDQSRVHRRKGVGGGTGFIRDIPEIETTVRFHNFFQMNERYEIASGRYHSHRAWDKLLRPVGVPAFEFDIYVSQEFIEDIEKAFKAGVTVGQGNLLMRFRLLGQPLTHPSGTDWPEDYMDHNINFPEVMVWMA